MACSVPHFVGGSEKDASKVLIADDDPAYRSLLEEAANRLCLTAITSSCGQHAWHVLRRDSSIAVAVLNWMLPDLDGLWIHARLAESRRQLKCVLMVGRAFKAELAARFDLAGWAILAKPFRLEEAVVSLRAVLNENHSPNGAMPVRLGMCGPLVWVLHADIRSF